VALLPESVTTGTATHVEDSTQAWKKLNDVPNLKRDFGAVGNDSADDTAAITNWLAEAGRGPLFAPPGVYRSTIQHAVASNTTIFGHGATIKATSTGTSDRILSLSDVTNVRIFGLTLDGNKAAFAGVTEQRHGFHIIGSSNVRLVDVAANNCKGDGLYLGRGTSAGCSNVVVERGVFNANHRNALSVIDITGGKFTDCEFTNTDGTTPEDGVDIEPNVTANTITDLVFTRCTISGNSGDGVGLNRLSTGVTPTVARIKFVDCAIKSNGLRGVILSYGNRLDIIDCDVESNAGHAINLEPTANSADINIRGGCIRDNLRTAVRATPAASMALTRLSVVDVDILDNSTEGNGFYEAIDIAARTTFITIANNLIANTGATGMDSPVKTADTTVTDLTLIGNRYQTISGNSLADQVASRVDTGNG
jgi:hypothetical protein